MNRCILTLILLILISAGTLYILGHKKKTLEPLTGKCLKGCMPATAITGNCRFLPQPNGKNIYSCPQECVAAAKADTSRAPTGICNYDTDCKYCNKTTLYPDGRPTQRRLGPGGLPPRPPSPWVGPGGLPPINIPSSPFGPGKTNKNVSLCPASTVVIFNS